MQVVVLKIISLFFNAVGLAEQYSIKRKTNKIIFSDDIVFPQEKTPEEERIILFVFVYLYFKSKNKNIFSTCVF